MSLWAEAVERKKTMIFDTHAHYDDHAFDDDREAVLASLIPGGVGAVIDVGSTVRSLGQVKELADSHDFLYGAVGIHPDEVGGLTPAVSGRIREALSDPKIVAVGEIGLDYHWDVEPHDVQIRCFREQIDIALEMKKPIIVHSRAANRDTMEVIAEAYGGGAGKAAAKKGVIHAYPGSLEQAKIYTELGFCLGIGGVLTYPTSKKLKKVVAGIPLDYLLLETDCPYLTPEPHRGERNCSLYLEAVARAISEIKGVTAEEVEKATWDNAERLFLDGR